MVVLKLFAKALLCCARALFLSWLAQQGGKDRHWLQQHQMSHPKGPEAARDFPWNSRNGVFASLGAERRDTCLCLALQDARLSFRA